MRNSVFWFWFLMIAGAVGIVWLYNTLVVGG